MKYIMFKTKPTGSSYETLMPVVFPNNLVHAIVAQAMTRAFLEHKMYSRPVSAGFVTLDGTCHGESETLKLKADPRDSHILSMHDYGAGIL